MQTLNIEDIIKVFVQYLPPVNLLLKKKRSMRHGMKKPHALTVRRNAACLIDLNEYLKYFPGATFNDKIGITEPNKIILNSVPTSCYIQAYLQGFDCESIMFKKIS